MEPLPKPDPAPSLAERLNDAWRAESSGNRTRGWRTGALLALLLPLGPLLTIGGARWMAARQDAAIVALADSPGARAARVEQGEATLLRQLGPTSLSQRIEQVARLLPADARIVSFGAIPVGTGARITLEIATPEPDRLRAAFARDTTGAKFRTVGEAQGDGVLIVSLEAVL